MEKGVNKRTSKAYVGVIRPGPVLLRKASVVATNESLAHLGSWTRIVSYSGSGKIVASPRGNWHIIAAGELDMHGILSFSSSGDQRCKPIS